MFEWPWQDPGIRGFLGLLGVTEKPEPPDDPRTALLELVDDSEPDELDILPYLRRGLEDVQDLAMCFDRVRTRPVREPGDGSSGPGARTRQMTH